MSLPMYLHMMSTTLRQRSISHEALPKFQDQLELT